MNSFKIAVVDSGIGGLSLLKTLVLNLNIKDYVYFADLKNIPYGTKTRDQLLCITIKNLKTIIKKYRPNIIVFGCNTIGSSVLEDIKRIFPNQAIFAIKPNLKNIKTKTLVIATNATINILLASSEYKDNKKNIVLCKMPKLATKVENYIQKGANLVPYLKSKLYKFNDCNNIILGCTHYYFVKNEIKKILPYAKFFDSRNVVLGQIKNYLNLNGRDFSLDDNSALNFSIKWHLTGNKEKIYLYKKIFSKILKN